MSGQLKMFSQTISEGSSSAISSPASADGVMPSGSLVGLAIGMYGPVRPRANPRVLPLGAETSLAIGGLNSDGLSLNAALGRSLASRFRAAPGSIASLLTWDVWTTPLGRRFYRLSASAKTISGSGFTLQATPTATANQACASMRKWPGCRGIEVTPEAWGRRMGYPETWLRCLDSAMPSSRKSRKSSSKRISQRRDNP